MYTSDHAGLNWQGDPDHHSCDRVISSEAEH